MLLSTLSPFPTSKIILSRPSGHRFLNLWIHEAFDERGVCSGGWCCVGFGFQLCLVYINNGLQPIQKICAPGLSSTNGHKPMKPILCIATIVGATIGLSPLSPFQVFQLGLGRSNGPESMSPIPCICTLVLHRAYATVTRASATVPRAFTRAFTVAPIT